MDKTEATEYVMVRIPVRVTEHDNGAYWFCEGLGIDYGAQGDTRKEALRHFAEGLRATCDVNAERGQYGFK